jgi:hypothetical protein
MVYYVGYTATRIYQQFHNNAMLFHEECLVALSTANISFDEMVLWCGRIRLHCIIYYYYKKQEYIGYDFIYLPFCSAELDKALQILDSKKAEYLEKWYSGIVYIFSWFMICV